MLSVLASVVFILMIVALVTGNVIAWIALFFAALILGVLVLSAEMDRL